MAEFISRCEEFLIEEFSPLDSQWSSEEFLSLSSNGLQKGLFCTKINSNVIGLRNKRWPSCTDARMVQVVV